MTKKQIQKVILSKKIPSDELDQGKYWGYTIPITIIIAFGTPLLPFVSNTIPLSVKLSGFILGMLLLICMYSSFKNEKNLKLIITNQDKASNQKIIEEYFKKRGISFTNYKNYSFALLPTLCYKKGLKAILLVEDQKVYINIRTIGFAFEGGRIPFSIGKILEEKKLNWYFKKIKAL